MKILKISSKDCQLGSITLFAATVLFPIIFFLLSISLDLTQLYAERASVQRVIDQAALYAYRFLPFQVQARHAVDTYLRSLSSIHGSYETYIDSGQVEITYHGRAPFFFAAFVGNSVGIPYDLHTRVRGTVMHAVVMVDSSSSVAPVSTEELWGAPALWPAANLFIHFKPFGSTVSPRFITQQCFNPAFNIIKRSAIGILDYLSSFSKNSVALGFYPGTLSSIDLVKNAQRSGTMLSDIRLGYFNTANSPYAKNSFCLAASEEIQHENPYEIPKKVNFTEIPHIPLGRLTDQVNYLVTSDSIANISMREVLWSRAIRPGQVSIQQILERSLAVLQDGGTYNQFEDKNRIAELPVDSIIILSSGLPKEGNAIFPDAIVQLSLKNSIMRIMETHRSNNHRTLLYFVIFDPFLNQIDISQIEALQTFLNQLIENNEVGQRFQARVVHSDHSDDIPTGIIRSLVLENNTAIIDK